MPIIFLSPPRSLNASKCVRRWKTDVLRHTNNNNKKKKQHFIQVSSFGGSWGLTTVPERHTTRRYSAGKVRQSLDKVRDLYASGFVIGLKSTIGTQCRVFSVYECAFKEIREKRRPQFLTWRFWYLGRCGDD